MLGGAPVVHLQRWSACRGGPQGRFHCTYIHYKSIQKLIKLTYQIIRATQANKDFFSGELLWHTSFYVQIFLIIFLIIFCFSFLLIKIEQQVNNNPMSIGWLSIINVFSIFLNQRSIVFQLDLVSVDRGRPTQKERSVGGWWRHKALQISPSAFRCRPTWKEGRQWLPALVIGSTSAVSTRPPREDFRSIFRDFLDRSEKFEPSRIPVIFLPFSSLHV